MHYNAVVSNKEREWRSFIPFVAEESWALSEDEGHYDRMPDALERRRRVESLSDGLGGAELVVLEIPEAIHAAERVIGVMVEPENIEKVLYYLYENQSEFSFDPVYMDRAEIKNDWMAIIFDDIYKLNKDEEHDFLEHALVLLERYKKRIVKMKIDATYKEMAIPVIDREIVAQEIDKVNDHA